MTQRRTQSPLTRSLAQTIRNRREALGWSAQDLADRCAEAGYSGIKREVIANIEQGRRQDISVDEAACFAHVLGGGTWRRLPPEATWEDIPQDVRGQSMAARQAWLTDLLQEAVQQMPDGPAWLADEFAWLRPPPDVDTAAWDEIGRLAEQLRQLTGGDRTARARQARADRRAERKDQQGAGERPHTGHGRASRGEH